MSASSWFSAPGKDRGNPRPVRTRWLKKLRTAWIIPGGTDRSFQSLRELEQPRHANELQKFARSLRVSAAYKGTQRYRGQSGLASPCWASPCRDVCRGVARSSAPGSLECSAVGLRGICGWQDDR